MWCSGNYCHIYFELSSHIFVQNLLIWNFQNLTDDGLVCISRCGGLTYLNLTWYIKSKLFFHVSQVRFCLSNSAITSCQVCTCYWRWHFSYSTRVSVSPTAKVTWWHSPPNDSAFIVSYSYMHACSVWYVCSLFGIVGVTDACLEALSKSCSHSLTTLDVNGCIGIKVRTWDLRSVCNYTCFNNTSMISSITTKDASGYPIVFFG